MNLEGEYPNPLGGFKGRNIYAISNGPSAMDGMLQSTSTWGPKQNLSNRLQMERAKKGKPNSFLEFSLEAEKPTLRQEGLKKGQKEGIKFEKIGKLTFPIPYFLLIRELMFTSFKKITFLK